VCVVANLSDLHDLSNETIHDYQPPSRNVLGISLLSFPFRTKYYTKTDKINQYINRQKYTILTYFG
jgi:hypothetical protein